MATIAETLGFDPLLEPMKPIYMQDVVYLHPWELEALPEYSCSIPTGTVVGKRWRRNMLFGHALGREHQVEEVERRMLKQPPPAEWIVGEYVEEPNPKLIGIKWYRVCFREGPNPRR